jgi:hypothetical protein
MHLALANPSIAEVPTRRRSGSTLSGEAFATMINLSGRRRFTSQRVVLYTVLAAGDHSGAVHTAQEALQLFRDAHNALIAGNDKVPGVFSVALEDAYFGVASGHQRILDFMDLAQRVLYAIDAGWHRQVPVLMDELVENSSRLLITLNSITAIYEAEARTHAKRVEDQLMAAMTEIKTISKEAQFVALNARIVAARAGSAGREFSVVATVLLSITNNIEKILDNALVKRNA